MNYLGNLTPGDPHTQVFARQCKCAGSTFSFSIRGGEAEAFRMPDALIRISVGIENADDLIANLEQANEKI